MIKLELLDRKGIEWAQETVIQHHYLHSPVDVRCSIEGYSVHLQYGSCSVGPIGLFLFGRPEATCCGDWYGGVDDVNAGRCAVTRWQVLNLARVWFHPDVQAGGKLYSQDLLPGFVDRKGRFRSTLASDAIMAACQRIGFDYLMKRPPCFPEEPFEIVWLLSYCDTTKHKGIIYRSSGFELYRTNKEKKQTWRVQLPKLSNDQVTQVLEASRVNPRSIQYRSRRAQLSFGF